MIPRARSLVVLLVLGAGALWAVLSGDNERTRTRVRYALERAGFPLSNVWTRIDTDRRMIILGGALASTQEQFDLLLFLTNFPIELSYVQQYLTTPERSLFPTNFDLGFNPYATNRAPVAATP